MKDLESKIDVVTVFGPAALNSDQAHVAVDLQGYHSAVIELAIGAGGITFDGSNYIEITLQHSDDGVTYTDVTVDDLTGADAPASIVVGQNTASCLKRLVAAHASAARYKIGYIGGKRYLDFDIEFTGTHGTATPIAVTLIKGDAELQPVA